MTHGGRGEVGEFSMVRSVRIAIHPSMRHRGLARKLVEHVHALYRPDFFGTVFGATPELLRFRRAVGYELVRVGASLGARTGEPAAVMIRPVSSRAFELLRALRQDLARQIDMQLELLRADGDVGFDASLPSCLREGLEAPRELSKQAINDGVTRYLHGPQTFQGAVYVITRAVEQASSGLSVLPEKQRKLIESRVLCRKGWADAARDAGYPTVSAAMRALRPALRALLKNSLGER
jgi:tRNA(Met) cytidine acetyltransferase